MRTHARVDRQPVEECLQTLPMHRGLERIRRTCPYFLRGFLFLARHREMGLEVHAEPRARVVSLASELGPHERHLFRI